MVRIGHSPDLPVGSDTQGIPKLPALPTQALRLLKSTHRVTKVTALGVGMDFTVRCPRFGMSQQI